MVHNQEFMLEARSKLSSIPPEPPPHLDVQVHWAPLGSAEGQRGILGGCSTVGIHWSLHRDIVRHLNAHHQLSDFRWHVQICC